MIKEIYKKYYLIFNPELFHYIKSPQDIYNNCQSLKKLPYSDDLLIYLTNIIVKACNDNKRMRVEDLLRIIKRILIRNTKLELNEKLLNNLFSLFTTYIYSRNEDIQWLATTLIKDRKLLDDQIDWLLKNYRTSRHVVNRLLKYPFFNSKIKNWAYNIWNHGELKDRKSEILGILIDNTIPAEFRNTDLETLLWGIYHSKNSSNHKSEMIKALFKKMSFKEIPDSVILLSEKLNDFSILKLISSKFEDIKANIKV